MVLVSSGRGRLGPEDAPRVAGAGKSDVRITSPGDLKPTEEMWFYQQAMRQYQNPKLAVRRAAELRGQQRRQRLAAMEWFGLSNARPRASSDPVPRRLFARLGLQQRLLPVPLDRRRRAGWWSSIRTPSAYYR